MAAVIEQLEKVPVKQRALALLLLVALLGVGFYFYLYQPKSAQIRAQQSRLSALNAEVQDLRAIEAKNKEFQNKIKDLQADLESQKQKLPSEREIPRLLEAISGFGRETGVEFISFRPGTEMMKDFYAEVPMSLALRGPFHNIGLFLDKISHYPRIISVSNLTMGSPQEKEGYLMLTSTCLATTYRYVEAAK